MNEYQVNPVSRKTLRSLALRVRQRYHTEDTLYFPIEDLLDIFCETIDGFNYEIVEDCELPPDIHAVTDVITGLIQIKQSVYVGACNGGGRDRMTIAHELGHFLTICFFGFKVLRSFHPEDVPLFRQPEWQAKCFAGELLIPAHLVRSMSPSQIADKCGVSLDAAAYQYTIMAKEDLRMA